MKRLLATFVLFLSAVSLAHAETANFGLLLGPAVRSEGGTALGFEVKGGYRFLQKVATNLYYWRVSSSADISGGGSTISSSSALSSFGLEALYGFPASNWSAGAKLGLMKASKDGTASDGLSTIAVSDSASSFAIAPTVVYEVPVSFMLVGAEASYFYSLSSSVPKALSMMVEGRVRF
jgi:hypothetical protein